MSNNKSKSVDKRPTNKNASATETDIVLVGTYRDKQLAWIEKNNVYNYPVTDEDGGRPFTDEDGGRAGCPQPADCARIKELWLYAGAKAKRHCFGAEFVGVQTKAEFLAANPTYAKKVGPCLKKS